MSPFLTTDRSRRHSYHAGRRGGPSRVARRASALARMDLGGSASRRSRERSHSLPAMADGREQPCSLHPRQGAPVYAFAGLPTALAGGKLCSRAGGAGAVARPMPRSAGRSDPMRSRATRSRSARRRRSSGPTKRRSRAKSSASRAACLPRARPDQHAGGRHGPRASRRRGRDGRESARRDSRRHRRRRSAAAELSDDPRRRPRERARRRA